MKALSLAAAAAAALFSPSAAVGAQFLSKNDLIIAIDTDVPASLSDYPDAEGPFNVLDNTPGTKYLNFGELNTGFMVTPFSGPSIIQSMVLTTANDAEARDPASWAVYGTNENIDLLAPGVDDGDSLIANWQLIAQGDVALPAARLTAGPALSFANSTSYAHYRVLFPTVKNAAGANSMQIADVGLFASNDGSGTSVLGILDNIAAFQLPAPDSRYPAAQSPPLVLDGTGPNLDLPSQSASPANEAPPNLIDGMAATKYLNFGELDSGFIVTPASGPSQVQSFQLTTANDSPSRDPSMWQLFGTNQPIVSVNNSYGTAETWTLIDEGAVALPDTRETLGPVVMVDNPTSYASYKMLFPNTKDPAAGDADSMQLAEASFFASLDGSGPDVLNPGDPILGIDATIRTGLQTKYLNFGQNNSGVIITPAAGAKVITGFKITTGDDAVERDPASFELYGTNSPIASADNSQGNGETWTLISSGALALPDERTTESELIPVTNSTSYTSYRLIFPTVKDDTMANSMQMTSLQFFDDSVVADVDLDDDGDVDGNDFLLIQRTAPTLIAEWRTQFGTGAISANVGSVPEPSAAVLALAAAGWTAAWRRRIGGCRGRSS